VGGSAFTLGWIDGWNCWANDGVREVKAARRRSLEELHLVCADQRLCTAGHVELAEDAIDMCFHGADGHHHGGGNLAVRFARGNQSQHLKLTCRERLQVGREDQGGGAEVLAGTGRAGECSRMERT
jgi:hypothetical protein